MIEYFKFLHEKLLEIFPTSSKRIRVILIVTPSFLFFSAAFLIYNNSRKKSERAERIDSTPHLTKIDYTFSNEGDDFYYEFELTNTGKVPAKIKTMEYVLYGGKPVMKILKNIPADTIMKKCTILPAGNVYKGDTLKQGITLIPRQEINISISVPPDTLIPMELKKFPQFQNSMILPDSVYKYKVYLKKNIYAAKIKIDYTSDLFPEDEISPLEFELVTPRAKLLDIDTKLLKGNKLNLNFTLRPLEGFK